MKTFSLLAAVLALGCTLAIGDAEAASKRFGAGKTSGMQRQASVPDKSPTTAPAQATGASAAQPAAAAAPQTQPKRSWMGPLAGLAAGLGLAALASHFGFGEQLASLLMIGLLVMAVMVAIGLFMRRRALARDPSAGQALQYAAASAATQPRHAEPLLPASGAIASVRPTGNIPADFDAAAFVRQAKVSFIRLQSANDAGNLDDIREFTTPEMFAEVSLTIAERGKLVQQTDVLTIDAEVVEVAEEPGRYVVSTRFTGLIREDSEAAAEPIDEIWHLVKPRDGSSGWVVAGIQQAQ